LFVSNDSGLAHIASALDVPTLMIVGPTDPDLVRPYRRPGMAVTADVSCAPCYRPSAQALNCTHPRACACLREITPRKVAWQAELCVHGGCTRPGMPLKSDAERRNEAPACRVPVNRTGNV
jgi:ADP-heptose:LPS heptosyltransferase